jgi:sigma-B regulation protein RsbU (phosphoserine phosphatase)
MTRQYTLLIVDDELSNLQKLHRTFLQDFEIFEAKSGEAALEFLDKKPVDVIITDQRMRGISGVDLLKESLLRSPQALRIILTGYTEVDYLMDAINQGQAHRYITKPWEPFALRQTVLQDLEHLRLKRENQVIGEQLRIAREVQSNLFPKTRPKVPGLDYTGICRMAGLVGGDYYDFLKLSEDEFCTAVGDISGKGISAALLMASLQALVRSHAPSHRSSLGRMFREINQLLCSLTDDSKFASFFCCVFQAETRRLYFVNAGHNPPLYLPLGNTGANHPQCVKQIPRSNSAPMYTLEPQGPVLGMFLRAEYSAESIILNSGDLLVIYTDGFSETMNRSGEEFGDDRLYSLIAANRHLAPSELETLIIGEINDFSGGAELRDDQTLVILKTG